MSSSLFRKIFTDHFPPPKFLEMPTIGLDISDEVIRFAGMRHRGSHLEVSTYGEKALPKGLIEEGYIKDKQGFTKILTDLRKQNNLQFVSVSLPDEKSYLFKTQIPAMDEADIRGALQFKIEENVPISVQDAVFDYRVMNHPKEGESIIDVGVTVLHAKVVKSYLDSIRASGLVPLYFKTESQAIVRSVIPKGDPGTHLIVTLRETKAVLILYSGGVIHFTSTLHIGSDSIINAIKKQFSVNDDVAQKIRQGREIRDSHDIFMTLVNAGNALQEEVQKLFMYWESHGNSKPINTVILTGSDSLLGLDVYLGKSLTIPVHIANAWVNIAPLGEYIPTITERESLDYVAALGLAIPHD
ncbi:MAG: pilus assembly protein PilM [Patescibacteria group bacterium]